MIPSEYSNFFVASTQASAALIGLLFVSVSIAPERSFGSRAEAGRQALALSAFTALANVFFVSFSSLIPHLSFGVFVVVAGVLAASQTIALLALIPSWWRERILPRSLALFAISAAIYGYEIAIGVRLTFASTDTGSLTTLLQLILGAYSIGLARAWELLGAPHGRGPITAFWEWLDSRRGTPADQPDVPKPANDAPREPEARA